MTVPTLEVPRPYLLFLGEATEPGFAKTALGLRDWAPEHCVGELALPGATITTGLPPLTVEAARAAGARALVIGIANVGGVVEPAWIPTLRAALRAGLDLVAGMHISLGSVAELRDEAARYGRRLIDVRSPPASIPMATGRRRTGRRLLTVGTDCALGKKYTALRLARAFAGRGLDAQFRATGQTGIMIAGSGIPLDAVVVDFAAGAAELLTPDAAPDHWDVVEGQGSLFHPAYAGVSLALLHGSQPDVFVLCHQPGRERMLGLERFPLPGLAEAAALTVLLGRRTNPNIRCGGVSLNTARLSEAERDRAFADAEATLGVPAADPMRPGLTFDRLAQNCLL